MYALSIIIWTEMFGIGALAEQKQYYVPILTNHSCFMDIIPHM